jgi:myo-inositol 2-dehydrogenase/D-chiro-inositol 1-dehydrogenase
MPRKSVEFLYTIRAGLSMSDRPRMGAIPACRWRANPMTPVRFGLIGYGAWGSHHARAVAAVPGAELAAVAAHSATSCEKARADYPAARVYADHREMLAREQLDAVAIVLPSDLHHRVARDVLESGRHLLLEKPMALSVADCDDLVRLARERGRVLAVGHELRVSSLWARVKELIAAGAIGEPLHALIELWRRPYRPGSGGWRYDLARVGDWILEEPIHFFDLARWYFAGVGEPVGVSAWANGKRPDRPELHDNFSAVVTFPRGRYAVISQTLAGWEHHQTAKITGTDGALVAAWGGATDRTFEPTFSLKVMRGDRVEEERIDTPPGEVYELVEQVARFTRAVREGTPVACTGEDGRWAVAMCLTAGEALAAGRPVPFAEG